MSPKHSKYALTVNVMKTNNVKYFSLQRCFRQLTLLRQMLSHVLSINQHLTSRRRKIRGNYRYCGIIDMHAILHG